MARSRLAALLAALALLAPASAFAQSAGDEQYQDPFGGDDQQQSSGGDQGSSGSSGSSSGSAGTTAQAAPTPAPTAPPVATTAQQSTPAAQQLPRTGSDPILPAVAGFWLLLGGVALRARLRLDDRRA
jgi:LPXTG-motif cell wall-anchored protein